MYRRYENPRKLEKELNDYLVAIENYPEMKNDPDTVITIAELRERINFAWQDDEYYNECANGRI